MGWRIDKQPNGKYARFSEVVDNFTHINMTRDEAVKLCLEKNMGSVDAEAKVQRADENPNRFEEDIKLIREDQQKQMMVMCSDTGVVGKSLL